MTRTAASLVVLLLAGVAGAADHTTATKHDELRAPSREAAGRKVQWAPTGNFSALHARAVFEEESSEAASPYAREGRQLSAVSFYQRWYDSTTGRFLSRDSVGAGSYLATPNGLGVWGYANGNPSRFTDPDGRCGQFGPAFGPLEALFCAESSARREQSAAAPVGNRVDFEVARGADAVRRSAPVQLTAGVVSVPKEAFDERYRLSMAELGYGDPATVAYARRLRDERVKEAGLGGLFPPYTAYKMAAGTVEGFGRAGKNIGEGLAACVEGQYYQCGRQLPWGVAEGVMLAEGGRSLAAGAVRAEIITGDLALPASTKTLNPLRWRFEFVGGPESAMSGVPFQIRYIPNKLRLLDIERYGSFNIPGRVGDSLAGHEVLQNAWLRERGLVDRRGVGAASRNNPALAVDKALHDRIGARQKDLGLFDARKLARMSARENIEKNIQVLRDVGIPEPVVGKLEQFVVEYAKDLGVY